MRSVTLGTQLGFRGLRASGVARITRVGRRLPARAGLVTVSLFLALTLPACALFKRFSFEPPTVRLEAVEVTRLDLLGGSLQLQLALYNPNAYELRGSQLNATLELEDTHFGEAVSSGVARLAPEAHTWVMVPLGFTWEGVGAAARALLHRGAVAYRLTGRLLVQTPAGERWVPVELKGEVTVRDVLGGA